MIIDADTIAKESAGNVRASNFVMLGAASPFIEIPFEYLEEGIRAIFSRKGAEIVEMNLKAPTCGPRIRSELQVTDETVKAAKTGTTAKMPPSSLPLLPFPFFLFHHFHRFIPSLPTFSLFTFYFSPFTFIVLSLLTK